MNRGLGIFGAVAGLVSAIILTTGIPSFGNAFEFGCSRSHDTANVSRSLPWAGGQSVEIRVPATVYFKVAPEWRAVATGPATILEHLRFSNGKIEFDESTNLCEADLKITLTGPAVRQWRLMGSGDLALQRLNQTDLDITVAGSGAAMATGTVQRTLATIKGSGALNLSGLQQADIDLLIEGSGSATAGGTTERTMISISGSGDARFGALAVKDAKVQIRGSGNVDITPENSADIQIHGSGSVRLLKQPRTINKWIQGSGTIVGG